jgi:hypothetical protein
MFFDFIFFVVCFPKVRLYATNVSRSSSKVISLFSG